MAAIGIDALPQGSQAEGGLAPVYQGDAAKRVRVGTAAYREAGLSTDNVPVLGTGGKLDSRVLPLVAMAGLTQGVQDAINSAGAAAAGAYPYITLHRDGERRVLHMDWRNADGSDNDTLTGGYLTAAGVVPDIAQGTDIRGATGRDGDVSGVFQDLLGIEESPQSTLSPGGVFNTAAFPVHDPMRIWPAYLGYKLRAVFRARYWNYTATNAVGNIMASLHDADGNLVVAFPDISVPADAVDMSIVAEVDIPTDHRHLALRIQNMGELVLISNFILRIHPFSSAGAGGEVSDAPLGTAAAEAANTDVAPTRRAVAQAVDVINLSLTEAATDLHAVVSNSSDFLNNPNEGGDEDTAISQQVAKHIFRAGRTLVAAWRGEGGDPTSATNHASLPPAVFIGANAGYNPNAQAVVFSGGGGVNSAIGWNNPVIDFRRANITCRFQTEANMALHMYFGGAEEPDTEAQSVWRKEVGMWVGLITDPNPVLYCGAGSTNDENFISNEASGFANTDGAYRVPLPGHTLASIKSGTHKLRCEMWLDRCLVYIDDIPITTFVVGDMANRPINRGGRFGVVVEKRGTGDTFLHDVAVAQADLISAEPSLALPVIRGIEYSAVSRIMRIRYSGNREESLLLAGGGGTQAQVSHDDYAFPGNTYIIRGGTGNVLAGTDARIGTPDSPEIPATELQVLGDRVRALVPLHLDVQISGTIRASSGAHYPTGGATTAVNGNINAKLMLHRAGVSNPSTLSFDFTSCPAPAYLTPFSLAATIGMQVGDELRVHLAASGASYIGGGRSTSCLIDSGSMGISRFADHPAYEAYTSQLPLTLTGNIDLPVATLNEGQVAVEFSPHFDSAYRPIMRLGFGNGVIGFPQATIDLRHNDIQTLEATAGLLDGSDSVPDALTGRMGHNTPLPIILGTGAPGDEMHIGAYWERIQRLFRVYSIVLLHDPLHSSLIVGCVITGLSGDDRSNYLYPITAGRG